MKNDPIQKSIKEIPRRQQGAQSLRRSIAILRCISKYNKIGARLSMVAKELDLPAPTVHRILTVLLEEEFLSFDSEAKLYHLGAELYSLGAGTRQFSMRDHFHATLEKISQQTDDATCLIIRSGYDGLCIDRVMGKSRVQVLGYEIGERRVLGVGAAGQALLSFLPTKQREKILATNAHRYEKYYGITIKEVRSWIKKSRKMKYSNSVHIVTQDSIGVGVPIFNLKGQVVAAISMASITMRMGPERCMEIAKIIQTEIAAVDPPPN